MTKQMLFFQMKMYYTTTNLALEQIIQQIFVNPFLKDKILKGFDKGLLTGMILINLRS